MANVLFLVPHQDDDSLSFGASARKHLEQGHRVRLLLLTTGEGSGVRPQTGLSLADFAAARDDEYRRACRALGIRWEDICFASPRPADGGITPEGVADAVRAHLTGFPDPWLKTYTDLELDGHHEDHRISGAAGRILLNEGAVPNLRMYLEPWLKAAYVERYPTLRLTAEQAAGVTRVHNALHEYEDQDQIGGRYAIGKLSVSSFFTKAHADPTNWYHLP